jgi:hypothetical protein
LVDTKKTLRWQRIPHRRGGEQWQHGVGDLSRDSGLAERGAMTCALKNLQRDII